MNYETQKKFITNCYNNCNGINTNCGYYKQELLIHFDKKKQCSIYKTIQNDIIKIKDNRNNITYPILRSIIK